jgi:hypothetical protein
MRRNLLVLVLVCVLGAMVLPSIASAVGWTVKDRSGNKMGKVVRSANGWCKVYDRAGRRCGEVNWTTNSGTRSYSAFKMYPGDQAPWKTAEILNAGDYQYNWYIDNVETSDNDGIVLKKNGYWFVYPWMIGQGGGLRGKVSLHCPGWAAAGAVFVLSKSFE